MTEMCPSQPSHSLYPGTSSFCKSTNCVACVSTDQLSTVLPTSNSNRQSFVFINGTVSFKSHVCLRIDPQNNLCPCLMEGSGVR